MKIVIVSDTHGGHEELGRLEGDVLIHCGDFEHLFQRDEHALGKIDDWFGVQKFRLILFIGGNHDQLLEAAVRKCPQPLRNARFLHDDALDFEGVKFYGSSWVPMLHGHAFFADDEDLVRAWSRIPNDVDVLITHTPPAGILDVSSAGARLGCVHLAARLKNLAPRLHCFGHVHGSRGIRAIGATTYVNATSVNSRFEIAHAPVEIEL